MRLQPVRPSSACAAGPLFWQGKPWGSALKEYQIFMNQGNRPTHQPSFPPLLESPMKSAWIMSFDHVIQPFLRIHIVWVKWNMCWATHARLLMMHVSRWRMTFLSRYLPPSTSSLLNLSLWQPTKLWPSRTAFHHAWPKFKFDSAQMPRLVG